MIVPMTEEYALQYLGWHYPEPYGFYNVPEEHFEEDLEEIRENLTNWFAVIDEGGNGRMIGFYEYSFYEKKW